MSHEDFDISEVPPLSSVPAAEMIFRGVCGGNCDVESHALGFHPSE
jgi:hypothetical protein